MSSHFNRVMFTPVSGGTGDFVVSAAVTGFRTPAVAAVPNGAPISYTAESADKAQWEDGFGIYTSGSVTLARTTVRDNSLGTTAKVNFTQPPIVFFEFHAEDTGLRDVFDAVNNAASTTLQHRHLTSDPTPATGIGVREEFLVETAADNVKTGGAFEFIATDVTPASEDFDFVLKLMTGGSAAAEKMRVSQAGLLSSITSAAINHSALVDIGAVSPVTQIFTEGTLSWALAPTSFGNNNMGANIVFAKTRNAVRSGHTVVQSGDNIMEVRAYGSDGTDYSLGARLKIEVDGTPSADNMPARFVWDTHAGGDAANSVTERMRLDSSGRLMAGGQGASIAFGGVTPHWQFHQNSDTAAIGIARFSNDDGFPRLRALKSKNATFGSHGAVGTEVSIFAIEPLVSDGDEFLIPCRIKFQTDGVVANNDVPGRIVFDCVPDGQNSSREAFRIDALGTKLQHWSSTNVSKDIYFQRARSDVEGTFTVVQSGDILGRILFQGADGTNFETGAYIQAVVDAAAGNNDMPTRLEFYTVPDGSVTPARGLKIDQDSRTVVGGPGLSGRLLVGIDTHFSLDGANPNVQSAAIGRWHYVASAFSTTSPAMAFSRSRNATIGSHTIVNQGDDLMHIGAWGSDGTNYIKAAEISVIVGNVPGTNDMPGNLQIKLTPDGQSAPVLMATFQQNGPLVLTSTTFPNVSMRNTAADAPSDFIGSLDFRGNDSAANLTIYSTIEAYVVTATNGSERGLISFTTTIDGGAGEAMRIHRTTTSGETALMIFDVDNSAVERVTVGAANSGGSGFKVLRIPN